MLDTPGGVYKTFVVDRAGVFKYYSKAARRNACVRKHAT